MELQQLEYFRAVAYEESISRAARKLHISQPALSISISKLEDELGTHLFDRVSGRIRLNNMGKIYLRRVEDVFRNLHEASLELTSQEEAYLTQISIASTTMSLCPLMLEAYLKIHPTQPFSHFVHSDDEIKRLLEMGDVDFAICSREIHGHDISWIPLLDDQLIILAPSDHPLCSRRYVEVQDLKNERFIVQRSASNLYGEYSAIFDDAGFIPHTCIVTNELEVLIRAVDAGAGIAVASFITSVRHTHSTVPKMLPLKTDNFHRTIGIARLNGHFFSKPVQEFYDFVIAYYKEQEIVQEKFFQGTYDTEPTA